MHHKLMIIVFCSFAGMLVTKTAIPQGFAEKKAIAEKNVAGRLRAAIQKLEVDSSMKHAIVSLYVEDAGTGIVVFDENSQLGLAPASCQKLFTSGAALELLGADYRFTTMLGYDGRIDNGVLNGNLYIVGSGDPTLGSWRYDATKEEVILGRWAAAVRKAGIRRYKGSLIVDDSRWGTQSLPGGWIWEDIGNYYGAGAWGLNWHENQYDLRLAAGAAPGDPAKVLAGSFTGLRWIDELKTGEAGSGDNAYIYSAPYDSVAFVRGTIPLQKEEFVIAGSAPCPPARAGYLLGQELAGEGGLGGTGLTTAGGSGVTVGTALGEGAAMGTGVSGTGVVLTARDFTAAGKEMPRPDTIIDRYFSPRLDSINYWFLKKSINLYGEALIRTLAYEKGRAGGSGGVASADGLAGRGVGLAEKNGGFPVGVAGGAGIKEAGAATTEKGVEIVRDFWSQHGIDRSAIHIQDGSGLSPQNRVTTGALVRVLRYARTRPWGPAFYQALPLINDMRMKSGAIGGARSYAGYQHSKDGEDYVFSMIVNNYDGPPAAVVKKMFSVLDLLK